jgi:hypothetical protein
MVVAFFVREHMIKLTETREINTAHHQPVAVVLWREDNRCDRQSRRRYDKDGVLI